MRFPRTRRLLILGPVFLITITLFVAALSQPTQVRAAASIPNGLPTTFGFGLGAGLDGNGLGSYPGDTSGWLHNSGVPWNYAYQYLAGGANTNTGWETWGSACSPWSRNFVSCYVQTATSQNLIPVFTYYEMLQSNGSCNSCSESQRDLSNLNNTSTMSAYYANFTSLMQQLAAGGKKVVVHVEPDLSGFVAQANSNPTATPASVTNTGSADLQGLGLTNTYTGYNQALLHLRDKYAPNVLLAFHFSPWAVPANVTTNTDPNVDVAGASTQIVNFIKGAGLTNNPSGISSWDLLFTDVADRDAAVTGVWWDRLNVTFPNFKRWENWVSGISAATNRWVMVWQVPLGNQYFQTENNSSGHMQDNRTEYFLSHVNELAQSGIMAGLFGVGNSGSTYYSDANNDGVTNPAAITTSAGISSGTITNNHPSTYADDDGGYVRIFTKAYYQAGAVPLTGVTPPTVTPTKQPTATPVPPTATPVPPTATRVPPTPTHTPSTPTPTPPASVTVSFTGVSNGVTLKGTVGITAKVTVPATATVTSVVFTLKNPNGTIHDTWTEHYAPYTYKGDNGTTPYGWNTTTVPNGANYVMVVVATTSAGTVTQQATFTIAN